MNIDQTDNFGTTALMYACEKGHEEIVEYLIKNGADVNSQIKFTKDQWTTRYDGYTSLMIAIGNGHTGTMKILLDHGADISIKGKDGKTAMNLLDVIKMIPISKLKEMRDMLVYFGDRQ